MENTCDDFLAFQEALKKMRKIDDNIVHSLNTTILTDSFGNSKSSASHCKELYESLKKSYDQRDVAIKTCISQASEKVRQLKEARQQNDSDLELLKKLRKEQTRFRLLQNELNVEEVVKDRSLKVFYERCRMFYKPTDIKI